MSSQATSQSRVQSSMTGAGVISPSINDGALDGEDADDVAGGGPENGADPETGVTGCYKLEVVISALC